MRANFKGIDKPILALGIITLASRLPFLGAGFGNDPDAWRVANNAKAMVASGIYTWSRPPGLPVHEILSALLYGGGPWMLNGVTALFSVVAVVFFALSMRLMNIRNYLLAGLMLAFVPIIYISSTVLMDYMWALGFIMLSLYMLLKKRVLWAGLFLGLAIGCRLTSGAMVLPFVIVLHRNFQDETQRKLFNHLGRFLFATVVTALIVFAPVLIKYGSGFLAFYDTASPPLKTALHKASFEVWGIFGTYLLLVIIAAAALAPSLLCAQETDGSRIWRRYIRPALIAIVLYLVAFLRLPSEAAYLIPLIPFVILLLAGSLKRWVMIIACASMILTSFVDLSCPTCYHSFQNGPFLADYLNRSRGIAFVRRILAQSGSLPHKTAVVVAWWEPYLRLLKEHGPADSVEYIYCLDSARYTYWIGRGYAIYHLPYIADYNKQYYGIDLQQVSTVLDIPY